MRKSLTLAILFVCLATVAQAQIVIGPASTLQWEVVNNGAVLSFNLTVDSLLPVTLTGVTCAASVPPVTNQQTCKVLLAPQVPIGTHSLVMTAQSGTVVSATSVPFAYTTLLIPLPSGLRIVRTWYGAVKYEWRA